MFSAPRATGSICLLVLALASLLGIALAHWFGKPLDAWAIAVGSGLLPVLWLARRALLPVRRFLNLTRSR